MTCSPETTPPFTKGAVILVTGASSGIGAAIALRLNGLGAEVIANGRDVSKLEALKQQAHAPASFHLEPRDLTVDMDGLPLWVEYLRTRYGKFSGLAFAAGKTATIPFMQYEHAAALKMFDLLCHAPLMLAKAVTDRRNCVTRGLALLFIAAAASIAPNKGQTVYGAAKAALVCAARCMAKELAPRSIRVNCISPGLVKTPMLEETIDLLGESFLEQEEALYPLGLGLPDDVANLAAFLLSPAARWITGQNVLIDGGRLG